MKVHIGPYRKNRKISVHIDPYDTWNMDTTLAHIIHPMLVQLKNTKHGSPYVDDEDVPDHIRSSNAPQKKDEWDTDEFVHDRWAWVLDEMIFAFDHKKNNDWEDQYYETKNYEELRNIEKRIENGFRLFGKYYSGLWD
jgi:hypothetical protein